MSLTSDRYEALLKARSEASRKVAAITAKEVDPIYRELAGKIEAGLETDRYMPHILEKLMDLEQARIVRALPDPHRRESDGRLEASEEFARGLGLDKKTVDAHLHQMYLKGLIFPTRSGPQLTRSTMQFKDSGTNNPGVHAALGREYLELWDAFDSQETRNTATVERQHARGGAWRIIPRWRAIKDIPGILPAEDIRQIMKSQQEAISVTNCPCRSCYVSRTCDIPIESCLNFAGAAQYNIARGSGRKVSLKEALDAVTELDKYPVVHLTPNQAGGETRLVCNCHWDCCSALRPVFAQNKYRFDELVTKSRFEAVVDPEECIGCQKCLEMCQFDALQMRYYAEYGEERSYVDPDQCMGCGSCVVNCPAGAMSMKLVRPPEHLPSAE